MSDDDRGFHTDGENDYNSELAEEEEDEEEEEASSLDESTDGFGSSSSRCVGSSHGEDNDDDDIDDDGTGCTSVDAGNDVDYTQQCDAVSHTSSAGSSERELSFNLDAKTGKLVSVDGAPISNLVSPPPAVKEDQEKVDMSIGKQSVYPPIMDPVHHHSDSDGNETQITTFTKWRNKNKDSSKRSPGNKKECNKKRNRKAKAKTNKPPISTTTTSTDNKPKNRGKTKGARKKSTTATNTKQSQSTPTSTKEDNRPTNKKSKPSLANNKIFSFFKKRDDKESKTRSSMALVEAEEKKRQSKLEKVQQKMLSKVEKDLLPSRKLTITHPECKLSSSVINGEICIHCKKQVDICDEKIYGEYCIARCFDYSDKHFYTSNEAVIKVYKRSYTSAARFIDYVNQGYLDKRDERTPPQCMLETSFVEALQINAWNERVGQWKKKMK